MKINDDARGILPMRKPGPKLGSNGGIVLPDGKPASEVVAPIQVNAANIAMYVAQHASFADELRKCHDEFALKNEIPQPGQQTTLRVLKACADFQAVCCTIVEDVRRREAASNSADAANGGSR